jgi:uncharacterized protein YceK
MNVEKRHRSLYMKKKRQLFSVAMVLISLAVLMLGGCGSLFEKKVKTVDVFWDTSLMQNVTRITDDGLDKAWAKISPDGLKMLYCEIPKNDSQYKIMLLRDVTVPAKTPLINDSSFAPAWYGNNTNFLYIAGQVPGL